MLTNEKNLTDIELISYLLQKNGEEKMKGKIRAKGTCPVCQSKFTEIPKLGYICAKDKTTPNRLYIDLYHKGQRIRIFSDKQGLTLDTYARAFDLLSHINYEIKNFSFDPTKYVKQELEKFYVANLLDQFLAFKINTIAPSYQKDYRRYVQIAKDFFGAKDVRELRKLDLINYKEHLENTRNYSEKTIKNILDNFGTFLRYCKSDLEILDNVPSFPAIETPQPKTNWLSSDVQRKALECVPDEHKPIIAFLMLHGCRPGEARALKCKDVNLASETITISATFSARDYREKRKGRKAKNALIPIHPESFRYIKNRVESNLPSAFLFINNRTGRHYAENKLRKVWNEVRKKTGLDKSIRLYDATRHSVGSQLGNSKVSAFNIKALLGHSTIKMTEKYVHPELENLRVDMKNLSLEDKTVTRLSPEIKANS